MGQNNLEQLPGMVCEVGRRSARAWLCAVGRVYIFTKNIAYNHIIYFQTILHIFTCQNSAVRI
jgi:hypothetical protein